MYIEMKRVPNYSDEIYKVINLLNNKIVVQMIP